MSQIGPRRYDSDKDFIHNSFMALILELETGFKAIAHPLHKGNLWVKYKPYWVKGR